MSGLEDWWDADTRERRLVLNRTGFRNPSQLMLGSLVDHVPPPAYFDWDRVRVDVYRRMGVIK